MAVMGAANAVIEYGWAHFAHAERRSMTEPIASPSSPINAKTKKTPRKHKGTAKVLSLNSEIVDLDPKPAAHKIAASSDHDHDGIIESADDFGDFDYDAVKADDGVELWLVRVPSAVRPVLSPPPAPAPGPGPVSPDSQCILILILFPLRIFVISPIYCR